MTAAVPLANASWREPSPRAAITSSIDINSLIFEAPHKKQQVYFLKKFGHSINLGNIAVSDIISLETLRRGIRGDTFGMFWDKNGY